MEEDGCYRPKRALEQTRQKNRYDPSPSDRDTSPEFVNVAIFCISASIDRHFRLYSSIRLSLPLQGTIQIIFRCHHFEHQLSLRVAIVAFHNPETVTALQHIDLNQPHAQLLIYLRGVACLPSTPQKNLELQNARTCASERRPSPVRTWPVSRQRAR